MKTYFVCMSSGGSKRGKETEGKRDAETETERRVKCGRAAPLLSDFLFLSERRFSNNCGMFHFVLGEGSRHVVTKWDTVKYSNIGDNLEKCVQYFIQELHLPSHPAANGQRTYRGRENSAKSCSYI